MSATHINTAHCLFFFFFLKVHIVFYFAENYPSENQLSFFQFLDTMGPSKLELKSKSCFLSKLVVFPSVTFL